MVAILFAAFSMAAMVVAIFRHKADLERPISHIVGIEGMMVITVRDFASKRRIELMCHRFLFFFDNIILIQRRTVILSLPLVLLVYSIMAFVTGIVYTRLEGCRYLIHR
jgi:hypothetical protein